jgi:hypothetical protein
MNSSSKTQDETMLDSSTGWDSVAGGLALA